ncbi:MAG: response regulator [Caulobacteraceae bacterium]|nr:response regulator [Caulobacteraceae bacterium]
MSVLVGYGIHAPALIAVAPGLQGMSPLTALGLLGLAAAAFAEIFQRPRLASLIAWAVLALSALLLGLNLALGSDPLGPAVAKTIFGYDPAAAGRTSVATAGCLLALAMASLNRARPHRADLLAGLSLAVSGMALIGYVYGVKDLYAVPIFRTMALHTATGILLMSGVSIFNQPEGGWAEVFTSKGVGGATVRRQFTFVLVPPIVGGLLLRAFDAHRLGPGAAMAFLVVLTIIPLALLILRDGRRLDAIEDERREKNALQEALASALERRLADQAQELAVESAERLKAEAALLRAQRMEAVGQLTGGIAHDFNNLLMAISGNLQLSLGQPGLEASVRRYLENAKQAVDKGSKMTGQLLAFSRIQKLNIRPIELDPVLRSARDLVGSALGPQIDIQMRLNAPGLWAATDPDQLELAILNLALNSRDAMPVGGSLTIESGAVRTRLSTEDKEGDYLWVRVTDTGQGMAPEVAARAVDPFYTTKPRGQGTGLGLSQVYGFVRQSGGDLKISSAVGSGASIELFLPQAPAAALANGPAARVGPAPANTGEGRLLLVIDDDRDVRSVMVDALKAAGFQIAQAASGEEGLELLEQLKPVAAIIDFIMPGMNGAEVARRVQKMRPGLPIVFVSGYFDTIALEGISGAVVLRKPFDVQGLSRTVSSLIH